MTEQKPIQVNVAANPQAIPAIVDSANAEAPIVLSQAPPMLASDRKPVRDKASSVVPATIVDQKK